MDKYLYLLWGFLFHWTMDSNAQLVAKFTAEECVKVYYQQGFDSNEEIDGWSIQSANNDYTWHLGNSKKAGIPNFHSINPSSMNSMVVFYSQTVQNEVLSSPEFLIQPDSYCSFYACFDGVFVMWANFIVEVVNVENQERSTLFDAFSWSQESGHERPKWLSFSFNLNEFANKKVKFVFTYKGIDGDDVLMDDFRLFSKSDDLNATAEITEGSEVHFQDLSTGNPLSWKWTFDGGIPEVSTARNPVITYNDAGNYAVKLVVSDDSGSESVVRNDFVVVRAVAPVAKIKLPQGGYTSPYAGYFLPINKEVAFTDVSSNRPTSWHWSLPGSSDVSSFVQSPVVTYNKEGIYDVSLKVSNVAGEDLLEYEKYIQAGGTQNIWNIETDESDKISAIPLGWYGYYGGTNWLGMIGFAELFDKPLVPGSISEVSVFFDKVSTVTSDTLIMLSVTSANNGLPGDVMATASVKAKDLIYDEEQWVATDFKFKEPIEVTDSFFVVMEGFPNQSNDSGTDDIAIAATTTRSQGGKSTVYHLLQEWDDQDKPTGNSQWLKNTDESLSFAIAPKFTFKSQANSVDHQLASGDIYVYWDKSGNQLVIDRIDKFDRVSIFTVDGNLVYDHLLLSPIIKTSSWESGVYVIKLLGKGTRLVQKVRLD